MLSTFWWTMILLLVETHQQTIHPLNFVLTLKLPVLFIWGNIFLYLCNTRHLVCLYFHEPCLPDVAFKKMRKSCSDHFKEFMTSLQLNGNCTYSTSLCEMSLLTISKRLSKPDCISRVINKKINTKLLLRPGEKGQKD